MPSGYISERIAEYIQTKYLGGLIGVGDLSKELNLSKGDILEGTLSLIEKNKIEIVKRYWCPDFHRIEVENLTNQDQSLVYCTECQLFYSKSVIVLEIYLRPI